MAGKKRGSHNALQGRKFLQGARGLVVQVLKRSVGIGASGNGQQGLSMKAVNGSVYGSTTTVGGGGGAGDNRESEVQLELEERVDELAEAFMLLIQATGFLEVSSF